jgi:NADPH-dependent glutamate synthase beta subunit-like oxidoreductase
MDTVNLSIDGQRVRVPSGFTILEAARSVDIYIPTLCHHPDLPPAKDRPSVPVVFQGQRKLENAMPAAAGAGCGLCVVEVEGVDELVGSCTMQVKEAMVVITGNQRIKATRQENLVPFMTRHRHACLQCAQQEGCARTQCSANVPENERCCSRFGHCELQSLAGYVGVLDSTPAWIPTDLATINDHPLFERDDNLCIGCTRCVRACGELRGVGALGFIYDESGQVLVGTVAPTLEAAGCKFCTACVEVCPTGALTDKAVNAATRQADIVPCKAACPAHIDVPGYLRSIAQGKADAAYAIIREKVPFPGILGRVCTHPCESVCRRGDVNAPIAICALKRYAADVQKGLWKRASKVAGDTGKKVAVVGAGPAGLTAAFYLRKQGHAVSLFESSRQAGGMLRYGIPEYRLPRTVLDREIKDILDLGVNFKSNQILGTDFSLDQLKHDGFDAVFLSVGARRSRRISFAGCNLPDILWGMDFLRRVAEGEDVNLPGSVVVIGGGNLAVDAALTALRCGATDVKMVCLEGLDEMPAGPTEIEMAEAEGVQILPTWGPAKIISEADQVTRLELLECTGHIDDQGNLCPEFSDKKECIPLDQVIVAVGQETDISFLEEDRLIKTVDGRIVVNPDTLESGMPGVFAGGDVIQTIGAVIDAIADGRRAAASIDRFLGGDGMIEEVLLARGDPGPQLGHDGDFAAWNRVAVPELDIATRVQGFREIVGRYSDGQAMQEAKRCLQCDLRLQIGCNPAPLQAWRPFDEAHINALPKSEGVYRLLDAEHHVLVIKGTANLRRDLLLALEENPQAARFEFEENKMYSQRESERIQQYVREHGEMPGSGADGLEDLY